MTESTHRLETSSRVLLSLALIATLLVVAAPALAGNSLATVEIQSVDLRETATGAELTVQGDGALAKQVAGGCFQNGMLVGPCGSGGRALKLIPPLTIPEEDLAEGLDIFDAALDAAVGAR